MGLRDKGAGRMLIGFMGIIILTFVFTAVVFAAKVDRILPSPVEGAEYVGPETCAPCHEKQAKDFERSTHAKFAVNDKDDLGQGCESCHGAGSKHVDAGGGKGVFIANLKKNPQGCFKCHLDKKAEFNLQYHHPVLEGKVSCVDCHDPHAEEVRTGSATTLDGANENCFKCHPDKKGPFVYEHDAMQEGCTICHNPHGSINDKLLVAGDINICMRCHYEQAFVSGGHSTASATSPSRFSGRGKKSCMGCHVAVHGSNFSKTLTME